LYRRATLCPFRGGGWRRVTSLSKNGRCRLSLSRSASLSSAPSPSFHLLPAHSASSSPLFFSLLSPRFLLFFSRCFSFSPFLSAGSLSPFLHLQLSSVISLPRAYFSLQSSRSRGRMGEEAAFLSLAATPRVRRSSHFSPRLSLQCLPLWLAHLPCRGVALIGVSTAEGTGLGTRNGGRGRGQPGAFSRHGGVRRLARGERRARERNKISVEGGVRWRRMSSRAGRWKREEDEAAAGEHQVRGGETGDEMKARKRMKVREEESTYGGIPSLPGHPRQLPHFPFSSRVCPMLLRFRVGSGPTEPPSDPLPRAVLPVTLSPPAPPPFHPHTALVPATRTILATRDWPGGGGVW